MKRTALQGSKLVLLSALVIPLIAACGGAPATVQPTAGTAAQATAAPAAEATAAPAAEATAAPAAEATAAPATEATAAPAATGKILRVWQGSTPDVVDPQKSSVTNEIIILQANYEGLTKLDSKLGAVPAAAESWEFDETGQKLTFKMREGLTYSDGSPLTAENFAYSIERTCDPATAGEYQFILFDIVGCSDFASALVTDTAALEAGRTMLMTEGVQMPDDNTLVINLTKKAPYFPYIAGLWVLYPAKQELIEAGGENWWKDAKNQIGNGPFQITDYNEGQLVTFEANKNYWEGTPKLDGIELVYQPDSAIALEAYNAGQLDVFQPDPSQLTLITEDATLSEEFKSYAGSNSFAMGFNLTLEPFNDKKMREAFAYAFDRETFCTVIRGDCVPIYSWLPQDVSGAIQDEAYKFDPEAAKAALAESSYGSADKLPEIKLSYNSDDPAQTPRMEWIAGQIREILGIEMVLDPVEGKTFSANRKDVATFPQFGGFSTNWYQDYPDPQNWLSTYWNSEAFAKRIGYKNEELDALMSQADSELDPAKREELNRQSNQILIDDLPSPFGYSIANQFLVKPNVTGYTETSADSELPGQWGSLLTIDVAR